MRGVSAERRCKISMRGIEAKYKSKSVRVPHPPISCPDSQPESRAKSLYLGFALPGLPPEIASMGCLHGLPPEIASAEITQLVLPKLPKFDFSP